LKRWTGARKVLFLMLIACFLIGVVAGCGTKNSDKSVFGDETKVVKVMYYDEQQFFRDYGELLYAKFDKLEIEVVTTNSIYAGNRGDEPFDYQKAFIDFIEKEKPDLVMLSSDQYKEYFEKGWLLDLEPLIQADKYDISTIMPGVIDSLKELSGGKLHGLAPRFSGTAIFYNVGLFKKHGVALPTDQMSWQEVLELAQQFPRDGAPDERIYGFTMNQYSQYSELLQSVAMTEGLMLVNAAQDQLTIGSDTWRNMYEFVVNAYRSGAIKLPADRDQMMGGNMSYEDYLLSNPFVAGKSAMMIESPYLIDQLRQTREQLPDREPVDYALVTAPVNPNDRERGGQVQLYNIFAVNAASEQTDAAWEVLKYINSEDMARIKSKSSSELLTRMNVTPERDGHSIEAFYKLKPSGINWYESFNKIPNFYGMFYGLLNEQLKESVENDKPVGDAIQTLLDEGTKQLIQARQMEEQKGNADFSSSEAGGGVIVESRPAESVEVTAE